MATHSYYVWLHIAGINEPRSAQQAEYTKVHNIFNL